MDVIKTIFNGFNRVYSGENVSKKHMFLFVITTIMSVTSAYFDDISNKVKAGLQVEPNIFFILFGTLASIITIVYISGYTLKFMQNIYIQEDIMPEHDRSVFSIFFKAFPLMLTWFAYAVGIIILSCLLFTNVLTAIIGIFLILTLIVLSGFIQFIFVEYVRDFNSDGLFNILKPFQYVPSTIGSLIISGLAFIPIWILFFIGCFIVGLIAGTVGIGHSSYVGAIIGGYCGMVFQLVWSYVLVHIFKEKYLNIEN